MYRRWSASIWQFCRCFQSPSTGHPGSTRGNISSPCGASFSWRELWADTSGDPPWNEIIELSIFRVFLSFVSRSSDRVTRLFHFTAQVSPAKQLINKDHVDCELRFTLVHPQLSISTVENLKRRSEISIRKKKKERKKFLPEETFRRKCVFKLFRRQLLGENFILFRAYRLFISTHKRVKRRRRRNSNDRQRSTSREKSGTLPSSHASLSFNLVFFLRSHPIARRP